jgi:two-component system cell cycle response regulator DivK
VKKILVAEDNQVNRELIREVLQRQGFEVVEAADGKEALSQVEKHSPDLVLLDIQMPEMDGFAVLRSLREVPKHKELKVVALTAYAMRDERQSALQAGFDAYISKPIELKAFKEDISRMLAEPSSA